MVKIRSPVLYDNRLQFRPEVERVVSLSVERFACWYAQRRDVLERVKANPMEDGCDYDLLASIPDVASSSAEQDYRIHFSKGECSLDEFISQASTSLDTLARLRELYHGETPQRP